MENEEYIENLKYLFKEEEIEKLNLPKRNSYTYLYIEDIEDYEYTNSIAYEMLRRNEEFKELTKKPFPTKTEDWTIKILELGLDPNINTFPNEPDVLLDYDAKKSRFFIESWDSHTIGDIKDGLKKLITYFFEKNEIFTLTDETNRYKINSYKKVEDVKFMDILIEHPKYYIPCLITNDFIRTDTSNMVRMQQISKDIPLRILEKDFLKTISFTDTKYKYTQISPFYSRPHISFPHSHITNIPINLNLEDDELIAYISKAKEEFKEQSLSIKHPLELIGNEYEEAEKPKSEQDFPTEKNKRKIAVADAFYAYDLFKILDPYFEQKRKELRATRDKSVKSLEYEYKNVKNSKKEKVIANLKDSFKDEIKQYSSDQLKFDISVIIELSLHKVERYLNYMKEYIEHKRYTELITGKATSKKDRKTTS